MKPSITIALISSTHPGADEHQRFHDRARVDFVDGGHVAAICGAAETGEHVELDPAGLAQLLRRAYLSGVEDAGGSVAAALRGLQELERERLAALAGEVVIDTPQVPELPAAGVDALGSSTVLTLADLDADEIEIDIGLGC